MLRHNVGHSFVGDKSDVPEGIQHVQIRIDARFLGKGGILVLAQILVYLEPDVRLGIEVEEALLGEELLDLFPAHPLGIGPFTEIEQSFRGMGLVRARFDLDDNNAANCLHIHGDRRFAVARMVLDLADKLVEIRKGLYGAIVGDPNKDLPTSAVGEGTELTAKVIGEGLLELKALAFPQGDEFTKSGLGHGNAPIMEFIFQAPLYPCRFDG